MRVQVACGLPLVDARSRPPSNDQPGLRDRSHLPHCCRWGRGIERMRCEHSERPGADRVFRWDGHGSPANWRQLLVVGRPTASRAKSGIVLTRKHPRRIMIVDGKSRSRSSTTGTLVGTRFQPALLDAIDAWRKEQDDLPTRPEADGSSNWAWLAKLSKESLCVVVGI